MLIGAGARLARIAGITIVIDYSWLLIFALLTYLLATEYMPGTSPGLSETGAWVLAALIAVLFFACVLAHEMGHALVARRAGLPVHAITLFLFGGVSHMEDEPGSPGDELRIAVVGPFISLALGVAFFGAMQLAAAADAPEFYAVFAYLAVINVALAVFNLLPGFPLDGGRVLRAAAWAATGDLLQATRIAAGAGQIMGGILVFVGLVIFAMAPLSNISILWLAFIGVFLIFAARSALRQIVLREKLHRVPVDVLMAAPPASVSPNASVASFVRESLFRVGASVVPVADEHGTMLGLVGLDEVRAIPRAEWDLRRLGDIMRRADAEPALAPDDNAWTAATTFEQADSQHAVVARDGHVVGLLTRDMLGRWLAGQGGAA